ncbi:ankyrin repeat domain-containing protein [Gemmatimonas aurantiaca]|uniref:ankyrin repeat domain-containing protein n=1 Tax=Gemmatimonas aurantiaca TaxID=173480 RepID=UPI00301D3AAB
MYPNPQDVLPLPSRPDVEQYRTRAKELVRAHHEAPAAVETWAQRWISALWRTGSADGQPTPPMPPHAHDVNRSVAQVAAFAMERLNGTRGALSQAQFVIARAHGFPSWTRLLQHLDASTRERSPVSHFEHAADAVVSGDLATLSTLLRADPALVHARSDREHGSTLLHYVSANGVENYRQRTPSNVCDIAATLLDAGADVRATCDVYGGGADTLSLAITSAHPRAAGVQLALADLLIARGARVVAGMVRACLANGCPEAAVHMGALCLARGIPLDLQELACVERVDLLADRLVERAPSAAESEEALSMAAWYDRRESIATLLDHGVPVDTPNGDGATALHVACYAGQEALVDTLLARGASVHRADATYGTTPLVWALHAWLVDGKTPASAYKAIIGRLLDAGADVKAEWIDDDRLRADEELWARLASGFRSSDRVRGQKSVGQN